MKKRPPRAPQIRSSAASNVYNGQNLSMAYDHMKIGEKAINHMQKALDLYATKRNHRKIRTTQRQLKRFYMSYPGEAGSASSEKARNR